MNIAAMGAVSAESAGRALSAPVVQKAAGAAPFSDLLSETIAHVDQLQDQAQAALTGLVTGTGVDVHQAMIATQKASMGFELALAVRNKAVQAYQQVMSMQF